MSDHNRDVLDLPEEQQLPKPRLFTGLLMAGLGLVIIAALLRIFDIDRFGNVLFVIAWAIMLVHFVLKVVSNFRFHRRMCVRDLGRLGVITAIMLQMLHLPFALYLMIASGIIYAVGFFGEWGGENA